MVLQMRLIIFEETDYSYQLWEWSFPSKISVNWAGYNIRIVIVNDNKLLFCKNLLKRIRLVAFIY